MRRLRGIGGYGLGGLVLASTTAWGLEPSDVLLFSKGSFSLRPQLGVSETYDDNVRYQSRDERDDFITMVSPGLIGQYGTLDHNFLKLGYTYDRLTYADNSELDANQHHVRFGGRVQLSRFTITGKDEIEFLSSVLGGAVTLSGSKIDRATYLDEYRLTYAATDKSSVYLEGTHTTYDYEKGVRLYDSRTLSGTVGFEYAAFSQTSFFGEVYVGSTTSDRNEPTLAPMPRADFVGGFAGVRGKFTEKVSGTVKAGYESRSFADDSPGGDVPVVEASVTARFTDRTRLTGSYSRRQRVSVEFSRSDYTADVISMLFQQELGNEGRMRALVRGTYSLASFEKNPAYPEPREDQVIEVGAQFLYDFKIWLRGFMAYDYLQLESNLGRITDYSVNRVTLGVQLGY